MSATVEVIELETRDISQSIALISLSKPVQVTNPLPLCTKDVGLDDEIESLRVIGLTQWQELKVSRIKCGPAY